MGARVASAVEWPLRSRCCCRPRRSRCVFDDDDARHGAAGGGWRRGTSGGAAVQSKRGDAHGGPRRRRAPPPRYSPASCGAGGRPPRPAGRARRRGARRSPAPASPWPAPGRGCHPRPPSRCRGRRSRRRRRRARARTRDVQLLEHVAERRRAHEGDGVAVRGPRVGGVRRVLRTRPRRQTGPKASGMPSAELACARPRRPCRTRSRRGRPRARGGVSPPVHRLSRVQSSCRASRCSGRPGSEAEAVGADPEDAVAEVAPRGGEDGAVGEVRGHAHAGHAPPVGGRRREGRRDVRRAPARSRRSGRGGPARREARRPASGECVARHGRGGRRVVGRWRGRRHSARPRTPQAMRGPLFARAVRARVVTWSSSFWWSTRAVPSASARSARGELPEGDVQGGRRGRVHLDVRQVAGVVPLRVVVAVLAPARVVVRAGRGEGGARGPPRRRPRRAGAARGGRRDAAHLDVQVEHAGGAGGGAQPSGGGGLERPVLPSRMIGGRINSIRDIWRREDMWSGVRCSVLKASEPSRESRRRQTPSQQPRDKTRAQRITGR
jgi:hypothetical protein